LYRRTTAEKDAGPLSRVSQKSAWYTESSEVNPETLEECP
jgi:hypothetical protein